MRVENTGKQNSHHFNFKPPTELYKARTFTILTRGKGNILRISKNYLQKT
jgi:hypothetical protein